MIVRVVSEHPATKNKRERIQKAPAHLSLSRICKSINGIDGKSAYLLRRDRKVSYEDSFGCIHTITIEDDDSRSEKQDPQINVGGKIGER